MIVANEASTTRDAVDSDVDNRCSKFTFIDTAGPQAAKWRTAWSSTACCAVWRPWSAPRCAS
ncbi:MAG: hypothetical protein ACLRZH_11580 [Ruthenibacterium lactatiformans]